VHPVVSLQIEYSLFSRDPEQHGNLGAVRERGMSLMAYSPLSKGLLAGRVRTVDDVPAGDRRRELPRFQPENMMHNARLLVQLEAMAAEKDVSLAALTLAWLLHQGREVIPIPSSKSRDHLEDNLRALDVSLSTEDLARIEAVCPIDAAAGTRYPAEQMSRVNV
jgi:aryl-alcohol dehydrogenase-like predicted oxidoreductase